MCTSALIKVQYVLIKCPENIQFLIYNRNVIKNKVTANLCFFTTTVELLIT